MIDIEFAHVYAGHSYGGEQKESIDALKNFITANGFGATDYQLSILIDDISDTAFTLDVDAYIAWVEGQGVQLNFLAFEGCFSPIAEELIARIDPGLLSLQSFRRTSTRALLLKTDTGMVGLRTEHQDGRITYSCSILSAAWTLCRLGCFDFPTNSLVQLTGKKWRAEKAVSILPDKYQESESRAFTLMRAAGFAEALKRLQNIYYPCPTSAS